MKKRKKNNGCCLSNAKPLSDCCEDTGVRQTTQQIIDMYKRNMYLGAEAMKDVEVTNVITGETATLDQIDKMMNN